MFDNYYSSLYGLTGEMNWNKMEFVDRDLESKYKEFDWEQELNKSKIFTILIVISYIFLLTTDLYINNLNFVITTYFLIAGPIIEITLSFISHRNMLSYKRYNLVKLLRVFMVYCVCAILISFPGVPYSPETYLRAIYIFFSYENFFFIYFLNFNLLIMILIPISNTGFLIWVQFNVFSLNEKFLIPELVVNYLFHYLTFLIKKNEISTKKEMFFEYFKNKNYTIYINQLVDMMNTMIISIKNNQVLFMNKHASNYFEIFKNTGPRWSVTNNSCFRLESRENENFLSIPQLKKEEFYNKQVGSFLNMITFCKSKDLSLISIMEGKSLKDVIRDNFNNDRLIDTQSFKRIGFFSNKNDNKDQCFEVFARKVQNDEEVVEFLIYDTTNIKLAEKDRIETKYKQKILSKIAHEFKTPLISIISIIQNISEHSFNRSITKKLNQINNLSNYTIFLINDIIQYVSQNTTLRVNRTNISIKEVIGFCYKVLKTLVEINEDKSQKIKAVLELDEQTYKCNIISDENRLKQILLNFISNSLKFTSSGRIMIKSKIKNENILRIIVQDTGIGIKEEEFDSILQENLQLNFEDDYNNKGTRIGLAICKNLAKTLNHNISFKSKYRVGTKFFIDVKIQNIGETKFKSDKELPNFKQLLTRRSDVIDDYPNTLLYHNGNKFTKDSSNYHSDSGNGTNMIPLNTQGDQPTLPRIFDLVKCGELENFKDEIKDEKSDLNALVVNNFNFSLGVNENLNSSFLIVVIDDHKLVRQNTISLIHSVLLSFKFTDYSILEGSDGIDLLDFVRKDKNGRIKCIFTDENMEYLNGSEAVKIIRKLEKGNKVQSQKIVSITAFDDSITNNNIMNSGVNFILSKPCTKSSIVDILRTYLQVK